MKIFPCVVLTIILIFLPTSSMAKIYINIDSPGEEGYPIAVAPFFDLVNGGDSTGVGNRLSEIIVEDLTICGLFKIIDRGAFVEDTKRSGIKKGEFDFKDWSVIEAAGLIKGGYNIYGDKIRVELRIYDVITQEQLAAKVFRGRVKEKTKIAHRISNEIYYQFTGERGFFTTKVAFVGTLTGNKEIYISDINGDGVIAVTKNKTINLTPSWSKDGTKLVFTSYKMGNPDIYIADLIKGIIKRVSFFKGINTGGNFSPDGLLALTLSKDGDADIYTMNPNGKELKRITSSWGIDISPVWSPDGKEIAFVSSRSGSPQIYIMERNGGNVKRLTYAGGHNVSPAWSPDGKRIAFAGRERGTYDIFIINRDGTGIMRLTQNEGNNEDPSWSPCGRYLIFTSNRSGRYELYVMRWNGKRAVRVSKIGGSCTNPSWSPWVDW